MWNNYFKYVKNKASMLRVNEYNIGEKNKFTVILLVKYEIRFLYLQDTTIVLSHNWCILTYHCEMNKNKSFHFSTFPFLFMKNDIMTPKTNFHKISEGINLKPMGGPSEQEDVIFHTLWQELFNVTAKHFMVCRIILIQSRKCCSNLWMECYTARKKCHRSSMKI
jgi:hypothetical protein